MRREELVSVLDIGTTKNCILVSQKEEDGYQIIGFGISPSFGMKKGTVTDIKKLTGSILNTLKNAEKMCGAKLKDVSIGITGEHVNSIVSKVEVDVSGKDGIITPKDIKRAIESASRYEMPEGKQILHTIPRRFSVDSIDEVENPVGMKGKRLGLEATIVIGDLTQIENMVMATQGTGLKVTDVVLQPYASGHAVLTGEEMTSGVCLIDIGGGTTDVAIFKGGVLYSTFVVPVGGNHITNDLSVALNLPFNEAERVKIEYGNCDLLSIERDEGIEIKYKDKPRQVSLQLISEVIEVRVRELFSYVNVLLYKSNLFHLFPAGIVITGGSALLKGIDVTAQREFGTSVRIGFPQEANQTWKMLNNPAYATVLGLLRLENRDDPYRKVTEKGNLPISILNKIKSWFSRLVEQ
ncbi:MAG: cell division protein FtsA [bacterium]